jgi:uncharacterized membrane protein
MKSSAKLLLTLPAVFLAHAGLSVLVVLCLLASIRHGATPAESPWFIPALLLCPIMPLAFIADYLLSQTQFVLVIVVNSFVYTVALTWTGSAIVRKMGKRKKT